jgi:hypothetical protein
MSHDEQIDLAIRRLLAARDMHRSAKRSVWSSTRELACIDWPAVASLERQRAAAHLSLLLDAKKKEQVSE